jgi:hypothetical protein
MWKKQWINIRALRNVLQLRLVRVIFITILPVLYFVRQKLESVKLLIGSPCLSETDEACDTYGHDCFAACLISSAGDFYKLLLYKSCGNLFSFQHLSLAISSHFICTCLFAHIRTPMIYCVINDNCVIIHWIYCIKQRHIRVFLNTEIVQHICKITCSDPNFFDTL